MMVCLYNVQLNPNHSREQTPQPERAPQPKANYLQGMGMSIFVEEIDQRHWKLIEKVTYLELNMRQKKDNDRCSS